MVDANLNPEIEEEEVAPEGLPEVEIEEEVEQEEQQETQDFSEEQEAIEFFSNLVRSSIKCFFSLSSSALAQVNVFIHFSCNLFHFLKVKSNRCFYWWSTLSICFKSFIPITTIRYVHVL